MNYKVSIISFGIFSALAVKLALFSTAMAFRWEHWGASILKTIALLFLVYEVIHECRKNLILEKDKINDIVYERSYYSVVTAVLAGAIITFFMSNELNLGPVVASSVVGLVGAMASKKYEIPIYCGSFVGMSSVVMYGDYQSLLFSAIISGIIFLIAGSVFSGFGGKLGVIAFGGTMAYSIITGKAYVVEPFPTESINSLIALYIIIGAVAAYIIHHRSRLSAVESSAVTGLIGGLLLPMVYGQSGELLAIVLFCGSFIGMSSRDRLNSLSHVILSGAMAAMFFIYTQNIFIGLGGKLGAIAFVSILSINGAIKIYDSQKNKTGEKSMVA
ncbi:hypothetical protein SAMN02745751_03608 [Dethiosulfatibacter aminovorans DSM 17477]|uniref:Uncharacterized protein n=1 Tax=Dethiosulfatibacter aminovorans DSM 17477 TaxID=1121476 RepID=A0A1M6MVQ6_9FIRM|nr:hypothetical protein [Dethiosulfatibacter aminovorans]SHJ87578.1 hypothetical protein SAMN02745751_03608 [Dethiosulfatibacter aminovorans DSM 17477]